jgi:hypothetical protein
MVAVLVVVELLTIPTLTGRIRIALIKNTAKNSDGQGDSLERILKEVLEK